MTNVIISSESIPALTVPELQNLKNFLNEFFDEITIVAYVRPPRSFIESSFQQSVKGPNLILNINHLYPNYRFKFEKFDIIFGHKHVLLWKFDPKSLFQNNVVHDFCHRLGIALSTATDDIRRNESLPKEALQLLFTYRKYYPYGQTSAEARENGFVIKEIKAIGSHKLRFSPAILRPIFSTHHDDIAWIEKRLNASLAENMDEDAANVNSYTDLLKINMAAVGQLKRLIGKEFLPPEIEGVTPEQVADLMHCLRLRLREEFNNKVNSKRNKHDRGKKHP